MELCGYTMCVTLQVNDMLDGAVWLHYVSTLQVNDEQRWEDIQELFHIPQACVNSAQALKQIYIRLVSPPSYPLSLSPKCLCLVYVCGGGLGLSFHGTISLRKQVHEGNLSL